jgi:hypothetical protein
MKKILALAVLMGAFLTGNLLAGNSTSAASKYCTAYSYWSTCNNTVYSSSQDFEVIRRDTARALNAYEIEFSSSNFDTSVWSPEYGSNAFFEGHWIYEPKTGNLYNSTSQIRGIYIQGQNFYISNNTGGSVAYYPGEEPEVTTQIRNGDAYAGSTYMVSAYRQ